MVLNHSKIIAYSCKQFNLKVVLLFVVSHKGKECDVLLSVVSDDEASKIFKFYQVLNCITLRNTGILKSLIVTGT